LRKLVGTLAVVTLAAHLVALPVTLEDLDSVNFALGVRHFDVAEHQPHPPGYPIFIALGKLGTGVLARLGVAAPEARGLAVWSALAAGVLPLCFVAFCRRLGGGEDGDARATIAAVLIVACPLFWFTASRPLSDAAGLAAAWAALAALAAGLAIPAAPGDRARTALVAGAFLAGLSIGFRSQMAILTMPMVLWAFITVARARLGIVAAAAAGVVVWAVPLVGFSGGPSHYLRALSSQAGEDFSGVVMLWTHPTPRAAFAAVIQTFVRPWDSPVLAGVILALAAAGVLVLLRRAPRALWLLAIAFGPYAVFHLLFQETVTIRYALPLVPLVAFLAAATLTEADGRAAGAGAVVIAGVGLALAGPAVTAYAKVPSPFFAMLSEMRLLEGRGARPIVGMQRRATTNGWS
jgi:hypothetical protein